MRRLKFKMPHTYVIIFSIVVLSAILANVIPAGEFARVINETGREIVVPGSFTYLEPVGCSFFDVFVSIQQGFISGGQIILFIIFAYISDCIFIV